MCQWSIIGSSLGTLCLIFFAHYVFIENLFYKEFCVFLKKTFYFLTSKKPGYFLIVPDVLEINEDRQCRKMI